MDGDDFPQIKSTSIKTPGLEDLENVNLDEVLSDGVAVGCCEDLSLNNIQVLMDADYEEEDDELFQENGKQSLERKKIKFLQTQKIKLPSGEMVASPSSNKPIVIRKASDSKKTASITSGVGALSKTHSKRSLLNYEGRGVDKHSLKKGSN